MRHILLLWLLMTVQTCFSAARAAEGKVVWVDASCQYFIADLGSEFGFYNWRTGLAPNEGDIVRGDTKGQGLVELRNTTQNGDIAVIPMALSPTTRALIHSSPVNCNRRWKSN